jgi:hypothetical protein
VFSAGSFSQPSGIPLFLKSKGVEARGLETSQGFMVRAGSHAVLTEVPSCHAYLKELRAALVDNGVLKSTGKIYTFTQDYLVPSPSTAAGVVLGRSANGRTEWKSKGGRTLKAIQESVESS